MSHLFWFLRFWLFYDKIWYHSYDMTWLFFQDKTSPSRLHMLVPDMPEVSSPGAPVTWSWMNAKVLHYHGNDGPKGRYMNVTFCTLCKMVHRTVALTLHRKSMNCYHTIRIHLWNMVHICTQPIYNARYKGLYVHIHVCYAYSIIL